MKRRVLEIAAVLALLVTPVWAAAAKVAVRDAWVRALPANAAGYFNITNESSASVVLTGARSDACGMVMLHKTSREGGMASMTHVPEIKIAPHQTVKFAPGGLHLMCMEPTAQMKPGKQVTFTLEFAGGTEQTATFAVKNAAGR